MEIEFETYRPLLFSIAYRMLGSAMEAEDIVQDAFIRYQQAAENQKIETPKAYLTTIVTRLCINQLNSARVQREQYLGPWLPEPILTADRPELVSPAKQITQYESISMAFLILLESLSPAERAVFLLREVFDFEYAEIAQMIGKSEVSCRKHYSRAKQHLSDHRPRFQSTPEEHEMLLNKFMQAIGAGDLEGLTSLLTQDVTFIPDGVGVRGAAIRILRGVDAVAPFVMNVRRFEPENARYDLQNVNGKTAIIIRSADGEPVVVISIQVVNGRIGQIHAVATPGKLRALQKFKP